jgi:hypothetical protein
LQANIFFFGGRNQFSLCVQQFRQVKDFFPLSFPPTFVSFLFSACERDEGRVSPRASGRQPAHGAKEVSETITELRPQLNLVPAHGTHLVSACEDEHVHLVVMADRASFGCEHPFRRGRRRLREGGRVAAFGNGRHSTHPGQKSSRRRVLRVLPHEPVDGRVSLLRDASQSSHGFSLARASQPSYELLLYGAPEECGSRLRTFLLQHLVMTSQVEVRSVPSDDGHAS